MESVPGRDDAIELKLEILVAVGSGVHYSPPRIRKSQAYYAIDPEVKAARNDKPGVNRTESLMPPTAF